MATLFSEEIIEMANRAPIFTTIIIIFGFFAFFATIIVLFGYSIQKIHDKIEKIAQEKAREYYQRTNRDRKCEIVRHIEEYHKETREEDDE